jgi:hypothetical protein
LYIETNNISAVQPSSNTRDEEFQALERKVVQLENELKASQLQLLENEQLKCSWEGKFRGLEREAIGLKDDLKASKERSNRIALLSTNAVEQEAYINSKYSTATQCEDEEARLRSALRLLEAKKQTLLKQESQDTILCIICQDRKKEVLLMPCTHLCLCNECNLPSIRQCPLCRANISSRVKVLL